MRNRSDRHRLPPFNESGIILVDKPLEWTSHDVVGFMRSRFNIQKAGHCGTLDPAASGLLVLVIGRFTKLSQKFSGEDKTYEAVIMLGVETDSQDMDGSIISEKDPSFVTSEMLKETINTFIGVQAQIPPMVSAVKKDGKKLYELARAGIEVEREAKTITISSIQINKIELPCADFTVTCSKGTYVRTLCSDIGAKLGCGAVLRGLKRTKSGSFDLKDAVSIETLRGWGQAELSDYMGNLMNEVILKNKQFTEF